MDLERLARIWEASLPEGVRAAKADLDALQAEITKTPEQLARENYTLITRIAGIPSVSARLRETGRSFHIHGSATGNEYVVFADSAGVRKAIYSGSGLGVRFDKVIALSADQVFGDPILTRALSRMKPESIIKGFRAIIR
jgi:hypothetical protein